MKRLTAILLTLAALLSLTACGGKDEDQPAEETSETEETAVAEPDEDVIPLTVWGPKEDQEFLKARVEAFQAAYTNDKFDIKVSVKEPEEAAEAALKGNKGVADVFVVPSTQLTPLQKAEAIYDLSRVDAVLTAVTGKTLQEISEANGAGAITAATRKDLLYAFPYACESYCLYYDPTCISAEQAKSWSTLLDAAAEAGKKVGMVLASGQYISSFFYGAGFKSSINDDGSTAINWNTSLEDGYSGVQVVKAINKIAKHDAFQSVLDGRMGDLMGNGTFAAAVGGKEEAEAAEQAFGENYMACALPSFTIGEDTVTAKSATSYLCMAVNPNAVNTGWAVVLAEYLTNEESQIDHFKKTGAVPTNLNAAESDTLKKKDMSAVGRAASGAVGKVQNVGENYWAPVADFGKKIASGTLTSDEIQGALDALVSAVGAPVPTATPEPTEKPAEEPAEE